LESHLDGNLNNLMIFTEVIVKGGGDRPKTGCEIS